MINVIELTGFKSFVSDRIDLGGLTVLTGLNSSGKSSVIQALLLLEKAARGERIYLPGHGEISESKNPYIEDHISISAEYENGTRIEICDDEIVTVGTREFPELIYIGADRFGPETSLSIETGSAKLGKRGENLFKCIEDNDDKIIPEILRHIDSEGDTFLFNLRAWLNIVSPNANFESHIEGKADLSYSTFNGYRAKNVGFGLSYTLPVITALLLGSLNPNNSIVIIENPEAHLHPRGQTEIAKLVCLCVQLGVQVIIETHSDHFFDGIRLFVKHNPDLSEKIKAYWFELDQNRNSHAEHVEIDTNGRVKGMPDGMFDQFLINASKLL